MLRHKHALLLSHVMLRRKHALCSDTTCTAVGVCYAQRLQLSPVMHCCRVAPSCLLQPASQGIFKGFELTISTISCKHD